MGQKGEILEIDFNGEIIASGFSPECSACRELEALGFNGMAYFSRPGKSSWDLKIPIKWGASRAVSETSHHGPRFLKFVPFNHVFEKAVTSHGQAESYS